MVAVLKLFVVGLLVVLVISAFCGIVAFFKDLHEFKTEKQLSLPRKKLIQAIIDEQALKEKGGDDDNVV